MLMPPCHWRLCAVFDAYLPLEALELCYFLLSSLVKLVCTNCNPPLQLLGSRPTKRAVKLSKWCSHSTTTERTAELLKWCSTSIGEIGTHVMLLSCPYSTTQCCVGCLLAVGGFGHVLLLTKLVGETCLHKPQSSIEDAWPQTNKKSS